MSDHQRPAKPPSDSARLTAAESSRKNPNAKAPPPIDTGAATIGEPEPVYKLPPEEQMARFEKELKENDWGHQPC